jgi:hypothetical protein
VLVTVVLAALALSVEASLRADFSPREEITPPTILDIVVSAEDSLYPPPDTGHFDERPETVFVYLSVEDLPTGEDVDAGREGGVGLDLLFFGRGTGLVALHAQEDCLRKSENGATGVVKCAFKHQAGEPVPPGNYTVDIYGPRGEDTVITRKFFVAEG